MKLPSVQTREAEAAFIRAGYKLIRTTGKHRVLSNGIHRITLAHNTNKPIIPITLSKILKTIGMSEDRFWGYMR